MPDPVFFGRVWHESFLETTVSQPLTHFPRVRPQDHDGANSRTEPQPGRLTALTALLLTAPPHNPGHAADGLSRRRKLGDRDTRQGPETPPNPSSRGASQSGNAPTGRRARHPDRVDRPPRSRKLGDSDTGQGPETSPNPRSRKLGDSDTGQGPEERLTGLPMPFEETEGRTRP